MKKNSILIAIISFIGLSLSGNAQGVGADTISLNGDWFFKTDPSNKGEENKWFAPGLNDRSWETMTVPSNWDTHNEYAHYAGKAWYRKAIKIPAQWKGKTLRLFFEAVNHDSKVWLNNKLLGTSNSGFLPFEFDVSSLLNFGAANTIVVCADNSFRVGAIWNWGGIRRPVFLLANNLVRISRQFISPSVDLNKNEAVVAVKVVIENKEAKPVNVDGEWQVTAKNGLRRSLPFKTSIAAKSSGEVFIKTILQKNEMHLWHFDDPFLYESKIILRNHNRVVHTVANHFGLRKIEVDNKNYTFRLNGESIRPMGFNLVPDDRTHGNSLPLWRVKEDVDLMKSLGANMARLTHLPLHEEMLDYLDEKGIMIYPEVPLWGFGELVDKNNPKPKEWLKKLIESQYNHPCIIGWSVGNEIGENPGVMDYVEDAIKYGRTQDTTRLAVMVSHTADRGKDPIQFSDIGLVNKYGSGIGMLADKMHGLHPDKVLFYSEYGYGQMKEDLDGNVDAKGMIDSIRNKPYLIGGSLWTFNDYRSSYMGTKEFSENRPWGIVDVFRQKKKAFYAFQKEYAPVRELNVSKQSSTTAIIKVTPRGKLDLPAYIVKDYLLVWKLVDVNGKVLQGSFDHLPLIKPGDAPINKNIRWNDEKNITSLKVSLLSPQNYSVYDTSIFFQKPPAPQILAATGSRTQMNNVQQNSGNIRVVFKKNEAATAYKIKYGRESLDNETESTINYFIDIPKLAIGETYQLALIAINNAGESQSEIKKVNVGYGTMPPVIYYQEATSNGFFVGYATQADDYLFRLQYTTSQGDYSNAQTIQSTTKGVLFVPGLQNGQRYFYRLQSVKQNSFVSAWSEERSVVPDGEQTLAAPIMQGVLYQGDEAIICFQPVKKAIGYKLMYRENEKAPWQTISINNAIIENYKIEGIHNKSYQYKIAAITDGSMQR